MMHARVAVLVMATLAMSQPAGSQSTADISAHTAMLNTPIGALAPMMSTPAPGAAMTRTLSLRVAQYSVAGLDATSYGATLGHAGRLMTHSITAAVRTCAACDKTLMLGLSGGRREFARKESGSKKIAFGVNGSAGWGHSDDFTALSATIGVPVSLSIDQASKARLNAFVTPGFGWGRTSVGTTKESGTRPMIGAGAGWTAPAGWGVHVGYQKTIIEDGGGTAGIAFSIRNAK